MSISSLRLNFLTFGSILKLSTADSNSAILLLHQSRIGNDRCTKLTAEFDCEQCSLARPRMDTKGAIKRLDSLFHSD